MTKKDGKEQYALSIGYTLMDRYVIEDVLDQNGLSITYKAKDTFREQTVTLKELYPAAIVSRNFDDGHNVECVKLSNESLFEEMKQKNIQKAKKMILLYPLEGIANIMHYFEANHTVYLVVEYVEGIELPTFIQKRHTEKMTLQKAVSVLQPVLNSLEIIHKAGLFHGRISPESIMLDQKRHAYLVGFGDPMEEVAQDIFDENTAREIAFAPVEQFVPGGAQDATTDVYAIAAVIYLCVTGVRPPAFYERVSDATKEIDPLIAPIDFKLQITREQSDVLMKALSIYSFDRYASISEFVTALRADEFEEENRPITVSPIFNKFVRRQTRNKRILTVCMIVCIILCIIFIPKGYKATQKWNKKIFMNKLYGMTIYEQCDTLAQLNDKQKARLGNDYRILQDDKTVSIEYYDQINNRLVPFEKLVFEDDYLYMLLDFRTNNKAIVTYLSPEGKDSYTIYLDKYGSYYQIEEELTQNNSSKKQSFKVSKDTPNGEKE